MPSTFRNASYYVNVASADVHNIDVDGSLSLDKFPDFFFFIFIQRVIKALPHSAEQYFKISFHCTFLIQATVVCVMLCFNITVRYCKNICNNTR